jgi:hypothetical protein
MKAFKGWTISVGLLLAATAANAQGAAPQDSTKPRYLAASDFSGPYADGPTGPAVPAPVYGRPIYGPQGYGARGYGAQVGPGPSEYGAPLMPPTEVYAVLRDNGFSPLGAPRLRGLFYSVSAINRRGDDGRLVIDARDGRIVRFVPADRFGGLGGYGGTGDGYYGNAPRPSYGPLEPMTRLEGPPPRPPGALPPKIASRMPQSIPMPQAAPPRLGETRLGEKRPADAKPLADKLTPAAPMQQSAAVQAKPADVAPAAPSASPAEVKPAAPTIQATQPMPKVQGLE